MIQDWVHKDELLNVIIPLHTRHATDPCRGRLFRHELLYILKCSDSCPNYTWQVIGCIKDKKYKYDKDDYGNKITKYYEIPDVIEDDTLIDYGRLHRPALILEIGEKKKFYPPW